MELIRKISVGPDYKDAMHYILGQKVLGNSYTIENILRDPSTFSFYIYIEGDDGQILMWKEFTKNVPVYIEFDINF